MKGLAAANSSYMYVSSAAFYKFLFTCIFPVSVGSLKKDKQQMNRYILCGQILEYLHKKRPAKCRQKSAKVFRGSK